MKSKPSKRVSYEAMKNSRSLSDWTKRPDDEIENNQERESKESKESKV